VLFIAVGILIRFLLNLNSLVFFGSAIVSLKQRVLILIISGLGGNFLVLLSCLLLNCLVLTGFLVIGGLVLRCLLTFLVVS